MIFSSVIAFLREFRLFSSHPITSSYYRRTQIKKLLLYTQTNSPYLSGDTFASLADYRVFGRNGHAKLNLASLRKARSLFVKSEFFEDLLTNHRNDINARVIITGNSDKNWDVIPELPKSVNLWLAQNSSIVDSRVRTLPLGIENLRHGRSGLPRFFREVEEPRINDRVLVPPMLNTNPIRPVTIKKTLENPRIFDTVKGYMSAEDYFFLAKNYRFVLCLEGNGYENHRIWETLYFGNFPVLLRSPWQDSLSYLNLPILVVDSPEEVTPQLLEEFRSQNASFLPGGTDCLWVPFWRELIESACGN